MGRTPRHRQLTDCMHLSHAKVGFCEFLQSLFAVTCHSSRSAMQAILPILALSFYFTEGGDDDNNGNGMTDHDGDGAMTTAMAARATAQRMTMDACMSGIGRSSPTPTCRSTLARGMMVATRQRWRRRRRSQILWWYTQQSNRSRGGGVVDGDDDDDNDDNNNDDDDDEDDDNDNDNDDDDNEGSGHENEDDNRRQQWRLAVVAIDGSRLLIAATAIGRQWQRWTTAAEYSGGGIYEMW